MISLITKSDYAEVKIIGAEIPRILNELCFDSITINDMRSIDEYEAIFMVHEKNLPALYSIVIRCGGEIVSVKKSFLKSKRQSLQRHSVFLISISAIAFLFCLLPMRIIFVDVTGNQKIDTTQILSVCRAEGLHPGTGRSEIRSEQIKNALIAQFPQIKWAGVNTLGSCAVVSVKENPAVLTREDNLPCDIVASSDGKIISVDVKDGEVRCASGDGVKTGDVLISGRMDVGACSLEKAASGEIYAETLHFVSSVIPKTVKRISGEGKIRYRISLHYQNFKIKLWFSSGIPDTTCGRISKEYFLMLPGDLKFPISLVVDSFAQYASSAGVYGVHSAENDLIDFSDAYIADSMVAGKIESVNRQMIIDDDVYRMDGIYCCHEMIGRTKAYEIGDVYGKNS